MVYQTETFCLFAARSAALLVQVLPVYLPPKDCNEQLFLRLFSDSINALHTRVTYYPLGSREKEL